jgi:hypothetical protein
MVYCDLERPPQLTPRLEIPTSTSTIAPSSPISAQEVTLASMVDQSPIWRDLGCGSLPASGSIALMEGGKQLAIGNC